jgi:hypothetical protein
MDKKLKQINIMQGLFSIQEEESECWWIESDVVESIREMFNTFPECAPTEPMTGSSSSVTLDLADA